MVKKKWLFVLLPYLLLSSCKKEHLVLVSGFEKDGFSLYWAHQIFTQGPRNLLFELYGNKRMPNQYEMHFEVSVDKNLIEARLSDVVDKGKCPWFPMPTIGDDDPNLCTPKGSFLIKEEQLAVGTYALRVVLHNVTLQGTLTVHEDRYVLDLPDSRKLSSSVKVVYPQPPGLVSGTVVFRNADLEPHALAFIDALSATGMVPAELPVYFHEQLNMDRHLDRRFWEPDNHSISLLYWKNAVDFIELFELAKQYFAQADGGFEIYLSSSDGDQARLNWEGMTVFPKGGST